MKTKTTATERITALLTPHERAELEVALAKARKTDPEKTNGHYLAEMAMRGIRAPASPATPAAVSGIEKLEAAFRASEETLAKEIATLARFMKQAVEANQALAARIEHLGETLKSTQELAAAAKASADKAQAAAENNAEIADAARLLAAAVESVGRLLA